jgi:hypothetical protein
MLVLKYVLLIVGLGLVGVAAGVVAYDVHLALDLRRC